MKTKSLLYSVIGVAIFFASCGKDNDPPNPNPGSVQLIKSDRYTSAGLGNFTIDFSYDSQKRITLYKATYDTNPSIDYRVETEYLTNEVIDKKYDVLNTLVETNHYFLNSRNLIDSSVERNGDLRSKLTYDNDDHMIQQTVYTQGNALQEIRTNVYQNGNLLSFTVTNPAGTIIYSFEYSNYDLSKNSTITNSNIGQPYRGKTSTNFARNATFHSGVVIQSEFEYQPTYDGSGKIIKIVSLAGPDILSEENITYY